MPANAPVAELSSFLDIRELSELLAVSVPTLYRWRSERHDMPQGFMVGGLVRWRRETVEQWIAEQEQKAQAS